METALTGNKDKERGATPPTRTEQNSIGFKANKQTINLNDKEQIFLLHTKTGKKEKTPLHKYKERK